ncbi:PAS domain S-box protein [Chromobacterium subtsugae]|uniref:histidine kinase n=1 Tax=Chromobacterium subtsugae TaxID=251747 RepID=A0ABS7FJN0_9NEIS|nr:MULTISPECIES: ATP-binding protein [Chromobacterium]MBW7568912.1 PAS domain S-box protein [Chromobacterium subtsugae]MBW8290257.1 PAS domain S-box protein [Chromobacterium subtsugae]WSE92089.1 ATP-binding protein [Chromobacterium subtsugae]WVH60463.1 ATP-binding protein [Chromobacterium subtsugae]
MPRLNRLTSLLLGCLLGAGLLFTEYWLLLEHDRAERLQEQQHWGALGTGLVVVQLEDALEHTRIMAQQLASNGQARGLAEMARRVVREDSVFAGIGTVALVEQNQRDAFENRIATSIRFLKNQHLQPSPVQLQYYPVASYLPDDANALPQGLDLSHLGDSKWLLDLARRSDQPMLLPSQLSGLGGIRLDIITRLGDDHTLLLLNLRQDKLMQPIGNELITDNPLHHVRLLIWSKNQPDVPLLDSAPGRPIPTEPPMFSRRSKVGGNELLLGAYSLQPVQPLLSPMAWTVLIASSATLALLLLLQQRQLLANRQLHEQLKQQQLLLEQNNRTLREQISDRVMSEQALAQSEARQRAILEASSDAIILIDRSGHILQTNPAAAKLVEQSAHSLENLPAGVLFPDLYNPDPGHAFEQTASQHEGRPFETRLLRSDEQQLPVELSLSRVVMPDDWFYVTVCRDISRRKEQEEALIQLKNSLAEQVEVQSRQLAALLDASPLAMAYIVDRNLRQVNHAFLELFQQQGQDVIGRPTMPYFENPEQWERTGKALYSLLNDGKVVQTEVRLRTGKGQLFWCRLHGRAVNPSVPKLGTIWVYLDISAQRSLEETLRHAKILAEETSRAKTEFLANMSHELRTPLHAILGFTEMGQLRAQSLGEAKLEQYFTRINTSGSRLLTLLNDLLDMAKMEVGRMDYNIGRGNLSQCLREACDEMTPMASRNQIRIDLECAPETLAADIDPFRIGQVIRNLLSNAVKFSPAGSEIRVRALLDEQDGQEWAHVSVADSGPGIPEKELETIFDKFIQSSTTKTGAGGTGLGLAISREIIHAHHGRIIADNLPDSGAIFTFSIPSHFQRNLEEGTPDASQTLAR